MSGVFKVLMVTGCLVGAVYLIAPKCAPLLNNEAMKALEAGDVKWAQKLLQQSIRLDSLPENNFNLAVLYEEKGNLKQAEFYYSQAMSLGSEPAFDALVDLYKSKGRHAQARQLLMSKGTEREDRKEQLQELERIQLHSAYNGAVEKFVEGDVSAAVSQLKTLTFAYPDFLLAYKSLGDIHFNQGNAEAADWYEIAVRKGLQDPVVLNNLGIIMMRQERYQRAAGYLRQAAALRPEDIQLKYNLACTLRDAHEYEAALRLFRNILSADPDFPGANNGIGGVYKAVGESDKAREYFRRELKLLEQDMGDPASRQERMAEACLGLGEFDRAKHFIDRAIVSDPNRQSAYYVRNCINENLGNWTAAKTDLEIARSLSATRPVTLGVLSPAVEPETPLQSVPLICLQKSSPQSEAAPVKQQPVVVTLKTGRQVQGNMIHRDSVRLVLEMLSGSGSAKITLFERDIEEVEELE